MIEEEIDASVMVIACCDMERGLVECRARVDVGGSIKEEPDTLIMPIQRYEMEWRDLVVGTSIDTGMTIEKELYALKMSVH